MHPRRPSATDRHNIKLLALLAAGLFSHQIASASEPKLRCSIEQGGTSRMVEFNQASDPYAAHPININDRFRFKAALVGKDGEVDYINLYTYYTKGAQAILVHQIKHVSPRVAPGAELSLGTNFVYSPLYEREMQYSCVLYRAAQ